jgi:hypothetical protein
MSNPAIRKVTLSALAAAALACLSGTALAQTVVANFAGLSLLDTNPLVGGNYAPPDTDGAIGINHFVEFINGGYAVYSRTGTLVAPAISDSTFWLNAGVSASLVNQGLSDTRIKFDPLSQRWFAAEITLGTGTGGTYQNNTALLAVSKTSNPLDGWTSTSFNVAGATRFNDYPTLSVDANAVYIGSNDFNPAGTSYIGSTLTSIPKSSLLAVVPTTTGMASFIQNTGAPPMGFTPQVPTNDAAAGSGSKIVSISATALNQIQITPINNTASAGATLGAAQTKAIALDSQSPLAKQPNGSQVIDTLDDRFSGTIYQVGNKIYAANAIAGTGGTHSAVHWLVIDATTNAIVQEGQIEDGARDLWQPSIAANANGDVVIGYNKSGLDMNISSFAAVGHTVSGVLSFGSQVLLKTSPVNNYTDGFGTPPSRWGDFSATMVDPTDPNTFWTIQEVAVGSTTWGTQISAISVAAAVPEPASFAMMLGGCTLLAGLTRRRRRLAA